MPSTSPEQKKTMSAIAHGWKPPAGSKVAKIPKAVAERFHNADMGRSESAPAKPKRRHAHLSNGVTRRKVFSA